MSIATPAGAIAFFHHWQSNFRIIFWSLIFQDVTFQLPNLNIFFSFIQTRFRSRAMSSSTIRPFSEAVLKFCEEGPFLPLVGYQSHLWTLLIYPGLGLAELAVQPKELLDTPSQPHHYPRRSFRLIYDRESFYNILLKNETFLFSLTFFSKKIYQIYTSIKSSILMGYFFRIIKYHFRTTERLQLFYYENENVIGQRCFVISVKKSISSKKKQVYCSSNIFSK